VAVGMWLFFVTMLVTIWPVLKVAASPVLCMPDGREAIVVADTYSVRTSSGTSTSVESDLYCVDATRHAFPQPWPYVTGVLMLEALLVLLLLRIVAAIRGRRRDAKEVAS